MTAKAFFIASTAGTLGLMAVILSPERADASLVLGAADNFAVLGASTVTNTGATTIDGNIGVYPGSAITGLETVTLTGGGTVHSGDTLAQQAQADATTAYNSLQGLSVTQNLTGQDLSTFAFAPGVYKYNSSAQLTGPLSLNFAGASNENFVFQIGSTLTTASDSSVTINNGNSTDHVYFLVGSSATLGTGTSFAGNILALQSITLATGATILDGRALALNGAVTMDHNTIGISRVSAVPIPGSILLFGTALLAFGAYGWRQKKQDAKASMCGSNSVRFHQYAFA